MDINRKSCQFSVCPVGYFLCFFMYFVKASSSGCVKRVLMRSFCVLYKLVWQHKGINLSITVRSFSSHVVTSCFSPPFLLQRHLLSLFPVGVSLFVHVLSFYFWVDTWGLFNCVKVLLFLLQKCVINSHFLREPSFSLPSTSLIHSADDTRYPLEIREGFFQSFQRKPKRSLG